MQAVILAGGSSSRFWPLNTRHKSLLRIQGKSLLLHTLESLQSEGVDRVIVVQGPEREIEQELEAPEGVELSFAVQEEPRGMGNALQQAREMVSGQFLVTGPYRVDAGRLAEKMRGAAEGKDGAVTGCLTSAPGQYGILDVEEENAVGIVEKPEPGDAPSDYRVISTYLLDDSFFQYLDEVEDRTVPEGTSAHTPSASRDGVGHEYSFEDALDIYMEENEVGFAELGEAPPSLKYPWDALEFAELLMEAQDREISDGAEIADSATIEGNVVVEDDVRIYENAVIRGPCYVGEGCVIGNNALVRSYTNLESGCRVGANMEVRGTVAQENLSTHSGFIGDSVLGRGVSVGAGAVTANRMVRKGGERPDVEVHVGSEGGTVDTGRNRLGALVGDSVDIGTQANLMPGVCIGARSFVGPSAMVMNNVGEDRRYFTKVEGKELER